jgi:hypothetical protein
VDREVAGGYDSDWVVHRERENGAEYALLAAGLSLLFDTLVFLRTNWSPLKIPMYAENELAIGYVVTVVGVLLLVAPAVRRMLDRYAPDAAAKSEPQLPQQPIGVHREGSSRFSLKSTFAKKAASWIIVTLGVLVGLLALSISGRRWIPDHTSDPYWYKSFIQTAGICLLGLTFIAGSLFAARNRRRGGLVFLTCAPLVAFFVGYPDAGYLAWDKQGNGIFYSPFLRIALGLTLLFFAPFVVPLFAMRNKKRAIYLFLISAALVSPVLVSSQWSVFNAHVSTGRQRLSIDDYLRMGVLFVSLWAAMCGVFLIEKSHVAKMWLGIRQAFQSWREKLKDLRSWAVKLLIELDAVPSLLNCSAQ